jgi:hypothetical protein
MKKIFKILSVMSILIMSFSSCEKGEDLITENAKSGGLISATSNIAFKIGVTGDMKIDIVIPKGPAINKIVVNKYYVSVDGDMSNVALLKEIAVDGANASVDDDGTSVYSTSFMTKYDELSNGLTVAGTDLSDPYNLKIGDKYFMTYTAIMDDGTEVNSAAGTAMSVANAWEGDYLYSIDYYHPTAGPADYAAPYSSYTDEDMYVSSVTSTTCEIGYGVWWDTYWFKFTIESDGSITNIEEDPAWGAGTYLAIPNVTPTITNEVSHYDAATGNIYLYYAYDGGSSDAAGRSQRVFHVTLKPKK